MDRELTFKLRANGYFAMSLDFAVIFHLLAK
jgi:hypothetical protein